MQLAIFALAAFLLHTPGQNNHEPSITIPNTLISIDGDNITLKAALSLALDGAHLKYRFEPYAEQLATSNFRTIHVRNYPLDDAIHELTVSYGHGKGPVLMVRQESGEYVFGLPHVELWIRNRPAANALADLLHASGLDWCEDVSDLPQTRVTYSRVSVPFETAFNDIVRAIKPKSALTFRYENGNCIISRADSSPRDRFVGQDIQLMYSFHALPAKDALGAVLACLHQNYILDCAGALQQYISKSGGPRSAINIVAELIQVDGPLTFEFGKSGILRVFRIAPGDAGPR